MIVLGILASVAGIGFFCWLLFTLAVHALPFFSGLTVGMFAYNSGAGPIGAFLIGAFVAGATLSLGQLIIANVRSVWLRLSIALAFRARCDRRIPRDAGVDPVDHALRGLADRFLGGRGDGHRRDCLATHRGDDPTRRCRPRPCSKLSRPLRRKRWRDRHLQSRSGHRSRPKPISLGQLTDILGRSVGRGPILYGLSPLLLGWDSLGLAFRGPSTLPERIEGVCRR